MNVAVFIIISAIDCFVKNSHVRPNLDGASVLPVNNKNFNLTAKSLILIICYATETLGFLMIARCAQVLLILLTSLSEVKTTGVYSVSLSLLSIEFIQKFIIYSRIKMVFRSIQNLNLYSFNLHSKHSTGNNFHGIYVCVIFFSSNISIHLIHLSHSYFFSKPRAIIQILTYPIYFIKLLLVIHWKSSIFKQDHPSRCQQLSIIVYSLSLCHKIQINDGKQVSLMFKNQWAQTSGIHSTLRLIPRTLNYIF